MTEPQPIPMVRKLLPRHTAAGIEVCYNDLCVMLKRDGKILSRQADAGRTVAFWFSHVTFEQIVAEADHYVDKEVTECL